MVHINGKDIDVAGQSLMDFLNANDYEMGTFVVECNEEIIHKEDYKTYILRDGDVIEVVQFMGGGCGTSLMYRSIVKNYSKKHNTEKRKNNEQRHIYIRRKRILLAFYFRIRKIFHGADQGCR